MAADGADEFREVLFESLDDVIGDAAIPLAARQAHLKFETLDCPMTNCVPKELDAREEGDAAAVCDILRFIW